MEERPDPVPIVMLYERYLDRFLNVFLFHFLKHFAVIVMLETTQQLSCSLDPTPYSSDGPFHLRLDSALAVPYKITR